MDDETPDRRAQFKGLWLALTPLLVSGGLTGIVAGWAAAAWAHLAPFSLVCWIVLIMPGYACTVSVACDATDGSDVGVRSLWGRFRQTWRLGAGLGAAPVIAAALAWSALQAWNQSREPVFLASLGLSAAVTSLLTWGMVAGLPVAVRNPSARTLRRSLVAGLGNVARHPGPLLGLLSLIVMLAWLTLKVTGTILFISPMIVAVASAFAVREWEERAKRTGGPLQEAPARSSAPMPRSTK